MQLRQSAQSGFKHTKTSSDVPSGQTVVGLCKNAWKLWNILQKEEIVHIWTLREFPVLLTKILSLPHVRLAEGRRAFGLVHLFYGWLSHCAAGWNCVWRNTVATTTGEQETWKEWWVILLWFLCATRCHCSFYQHNIGKKNKIFPDFSSPWFSTRKW